VEIPAASSGAFAQDTFSLPANLLEERRYENIAA
jgi:hypothetical protein